MTELTGIASGVEVSGYRVDELIGRGGMGRSTARGTSDSSGTWRSRSSYPDYADDDAFRERLLRESRLAASLDHPNVVPVYDAGEAVGRFFLAMRYVEGTDLRAVLRGEGALSPERAIDIASQVAERWTLLTEGSRPPRRQAVERPHRRAGHCYLADFGLTQSVVARSDDGRLAARNARLRRSGADPRR